MSKQGGTSVFQDINIDDAVENLIAEGLTPCFKLNSERLNAIQDYLMDKDCGDVNPPPITTEISITINLRNTMIELYVRAIPKTT